MRTQTSQHSRFRHPTILFFFFEESINDSFVSPYETRVSNFLSRPDNLAFSQVPGTARDHTGPRSPVHFCLFIWSTLSIPRAPRTTLLLTCAGERRLLVSCGNRCGGCSWHSISWRTSQLKCPAVLLLTTFKGGVVGSPT